MSEKFWESCALPLLAVWYTASHGIAQPSSKFSYPNFLIWQKQKAVAMQLPFAKKCLHLTQFNTQAYRSGHNETVLKTVRAKAHGGSNPSACANKKAPLAGAFLLALTEIRENPTAKRIGVRSLAAERRPLARRRQGEVPSHYVRASLSRCAPLVGAFCSLAV